MENNKILATVNGNSITERDIDAMIMAMGQQGAAYNNPQGRAMILDQVINKEMIIAEILQALAGSMGMLLTLPLTSAVCAAIYDKKEVR